MSNGKITEDEGYFLNAGLRVRKIRKDQDLSVAVFAERIGEKPHRVSDVETNRQRLPTDMAARIVDVFGISPEYILTGREPMYAARATPDGVLPFDAELLRDVVEGLEIFLEKRGWQVPPDKKALLVQHLYEEFSARDAGKSATLDLSAFENVVRLARSG